MDALEAIRTRRMIPRVEDRPPSRQEIEELLELAVRAPNHHGTEPWRFYVLQGEGRDRLARAIADEAIEKGTDVSRARGDAKTKVERAPVIVVFTCLPSNEAKIVEQEELGSVAMAMENFLIAAYAKGFGAMLRTGPAAYHSSIREHLGLDENERVVGCVYLGYPAGPREETPRSAATQYTRWYD